MSQADRMNRQARVLAAVQENTQTVLNSSSNELPGIHAGTIAEALHMDRANVARELNNLYRNGKPDPVHLPFHFIQRISEGIFPFNAAEGRSAAGLCFRIYPASGAGSGTEAGNHIVPGNDGRRQ